MHSLLARVSGLVGLSLLVGAAALGGCGGGDTSTTNTGGDGGGGGGGGSDGGTTGDDGGASGNDGGGAQKDGSAGAHAIKTIFLIVFENHNWVTGTSKEPEVIKGNAAAPYINGLLAKGAHAEKYFDNPKKVHPSEPNYIWLEAGDNLGITTDADPKVNHQGTKQHLVTLLEAAGVSWKSYQEDVTTGTCPVASSGLYAAKHNPMVFFDDVVGTPPSTSSARCLAHVFGYGDLANDLTQNKVAQYNLITPNLCDDMHNASGCATGDAVGNGDTWLAAELPKILASKAYTDNGAVFITWDESEGGELPIGMIVLSPLAKVGYANTTTTFYHSSMLRTVEEVFGVTPLLGDAANQPSLGDLFTTYP